MAASPEASVITATRAASPVVAGGNTGEAALVAVITEASGLAATPPTQTYAFSTITLGAAFQGKFVKIKHTVGATEETRSTHALTSATTVAALLQEINSFSAFSDGFKINATAVVTNQRLSGIKFTGNKAGSAESYMLDATNPVPFNVASAVSGANHRLDFQFVSAPAGLLTYASVGQTWHIDGADYGLPLVVIQPITEPAARFGLRFMLPQGTHDRTIKYALSIIK